jgi:large subunit ribosomal protein L21
MYAVIRTGGKQYRVAKDAVLKVESLVGDVGSKLTLGDVLMLGGEKVIAFKKKRRKNTHRKRGHRQHFTKVKVLSISAGKE